MEKANTRFPIKRSSITNKTIPSPDSTHWLGYGARCPCSRTPRSTRCRFSPAFVAKTVNFRFCVNVWRIPIVAESVASPGDPASIDILRTELCRWDYLEIFTCLSNRIKDSRLEFCFVSNFVSS